MDCEWSLGYIQLIGYRVALEGLGKGGIGGNMLAILAVVVFLGEGVFGGMSLYWVMCWVKPPFGKNYVMIGGVILPKCRNKYIINVGKIILRVGFHAPRN